MNITSLLQTVRLSLLTIAVSMIFVFSEGSRAGETFQDCEMCPEMTVIPVGEFFMGADIGKDQSLPIHKVKINKSFAVSTYPITVGQYRVFAEADPFAITTDRCETYAEDGNLQSNWNANWHSSGFAQKEDHPVVCISWVDSIRYIRWLSIETGHKYRLLSESEWEYIARANQDQDLLEEIGAGDSGNWGGQGNDGKACCFGKVSGADKWHFTSPVDAFPPNDFGVYDMQGNTSDLVSDCVNYDYIGAPSDGSAWLTPDRIVPDWAKFAWTNENECFGRILRGNNWSTQPFAKGWFARRGWWYLSHASNVFGFRVALTR